jgi:hypothetical protein
LYCIRVRFYVLIETGKRALLLDLDLGITVIQLGDAFNGFLLPGNNCGWAEGVGLLWLVWGAIKIGGLCLKMMVKN